MNQTPTSHGRRDRLRLVTRQVHGQLDQRIMALQPFADLERYKAFLLTQHALHRDVQALFVDPALNWRLPGLSERSRLELVEQDLVDLGVVVDRSSLPPPAFAAGCDAELGTALGWLYTVEGSNMGAAFLLKAAARLGLKATHGARHLAPHADGRATHWRDFTAQLDGVILTPDQEAAVDAGAQAAFAAALAHVERHGPVAV